MKPVYYSFIALITCLLTATMALSQTADIYPNVPVVNNPVVADIIYSPGDSIYEYEWLVNSESVKQGQGIQSFRVTFNESFQPEADGSCIDSTEVDLVPGWFGNAVHVGEGQVHLAYENNHDILLDSGALSFWIKYDQDISNPIYNNWSTVFSYRIDDNNSLTVQVLQNKQILIGTSQINGSYESIGYRPDDFAFEANKWHHYAWRWNAATGVQSLYIDGEKMYQYDNYRAPVGEAGEFIIGSTIWPGSVNAFATIDEFRLYSEYLASSEIQAIYQYPDKDIDAILEADHFETGDTIAFRYRTYNGGSWSGYSQSEEYIVDENPISLNDSIHDILLPGTLADSFAVETQEPCNCKTDTVNAPYDHMKHEMEGSGSTGHSFSFSPETDVPYEWIVKCAPSASPGTPYLVSEQYNTRLLRDFQPDYPRLMHLYAWWTDNFDLLPRYDVVVAGYVPKRELLKAREINPDLKVLKVYPFSYGSQYEDIFREASNDTTNALYNCLICDSQDSILTEEFWLHPMYNLANPACVDYLVDRIMEKWEDDLLYYDGIFFDRVHGGVNWMWDDMDLNRDGVPDEWWEIDEAWQAGVEYMLTKLRERAPNTPVVGNSAILDYGTWLNGKLFEVFLSFYLQGWHDDYDQYVNEYINWNDQNRGPWNLSLISMGGSRDCFSYGSEFTCPESVLEETRTNYQIMRFGLTTTLMGDGLYLYDIESPVWGQTWWYDEYDISLGEPLGAATSGQFWRRDFEHGIALVNPYSDTAHIELEQTYWAFYGVQDPETNNGQPMTKLDLPPKDGRILLNYEPVRVENKNMNRNNAFKFYPNPASEFIVINSKERANLKIYSMQGQLLCSKNLYSTEQTIPVGQLEPGNYVVSLVSESEVSSGILIIK
ncbi:MAG: putative glycoside hydrolase [Bacteroidales bacterium]|jgi:hypothetical protein